MYWFFSDFGNFNRKSQFPPQVVDLILLSKTVLLDRPNQFRIFAYFSLPCVAQHCLRVSLPNWGAMFVGHGGDRTTTHYVDAGGVRALCCFGSTRNAFCNGDAVAVVCCLAGSPLLFVVSDCVARPGIYASVCFWVEVTSPVFGGKWLQGRNEERR
ncbi:MAG: hypothetical protein ACI9PY_002200 [Ascidiaceihabitans sp.]